MIGVIRSFTTESTILPNAAPMMTPTARSITLPLTANSLNSCRIPIVIPLVAAVGVAEFSRRGARCERRPLRSEQEQRRQSEEDEEPARVGASGNHYRRAERGVAAELSHGGRNYHTHDRGE